MKITKSQLKQIIKEELESTPHVSGDAEVSPRSNARMIQMLYSRLIELEKHVNSAGPGETTE